MVNQSRKRFSSTKLTQSSSSPEEFEQSSLSADANSIISIGESNSIIAIDEANSIIAIDEAKQSSPSTKPTQSSPSMKPNNHRHWRSQFNHRHQWSQLNHRHERSQAIISISWHHRQTPHRDQRITLFNLRQLINHRF